MATARSDVTTPDLSVGFLDGDHVIRLVRALLLRDEKSEFDYVSQFFDPETLALERWERMTRGLSFRPEQLGVAGQMNADCSVLVLRRGLIDTALMDAHPRLKLIQRLGAHPEGIDISAAEQRGIFVSCMPRPSLVMVAEHCIGLMLALTKKLIIANAEVGAASLAPGAKGDVAYNWLGIEGIGTLWGKSLGIIGMGEVGILLAERAQSFGMKILYCDERPISPLLSEKLGAAHCTKNELLRNADFVSVHVPGTPVNNWVIDAPELTLMKPTSTLINTSRGSTVNETALLDALSNGHLAGAGLDVHSAEPRPTDALSKLNNVVLTPHMAGGSRLGVLNEIEQIFDNLRAIVDGKTPPHALHAGGL